MISKGIVRRHGDAIDTLQDVKYRRQCAFGRKADTLTTSYVRF